MSLHLVGSCHLASLCEIGRRVQVFTRIVVCIRPPRPHGKVGRHAVQRLLRTRRQVLRTLLRAVRPSLSRPLVAPRRSRRRKCLLTLPGRLSARCAPARALRAGFGPPLRGGEVLVARAGRGAPRCGVPVGAGVVPPPLLG